MPSLFAQPPRAIRLRVSMQYGQALASLLRALPPVSRPARGLRGTAQLRPLPGTTQARRAATAGPGLPQRRQRLRALRGRTRPARPARAGLRHARHGL